MSETAKGLYWGGVTNLALAAIINNTFWDEVSTRAWLGTFGAWNEVLGVLLVASPELVPRAKVALGVARREAGSLRRRIEALVRRWLKSPKHHTLSAGVGSVLVLGGSARGVVGPPQGSLEDRVVWLIARVAHIEDKQEEIVVTVGEMPGLWRADIAAEREELEGLQQRLVQQLADRHIRLRLLGVLYVVIGLALAWLANFV